MNEKSERPAGRKRKSAVPRRTIDLTATRLDESRAGADATDSGRERAPSEVTTVDAAALSAAASEPVSPAGDAGHEMAAKGQAPSEVTTVDAAAAVHTPELAQASASAPDEEPAHFGRGPRPSLASTATEEPPVERRASSEPALDVFGEPPRERPSLLPPLVAALLGGVAGAAIVLAFVLAGQLPGFRGADESFAPRIAGLEQDLQSARRIVDETAGRVAVAESAVKASAQAADNAVALAQEARAAVGTPSGPSAPADGAATEKLAELDKAVADLRSSLAAIEERSNAAVASGSKAETDLAAAAARIDTIETSLAAVAPDRAAAYAVALSQLEDAIRRGGPFAEELRTASALADGSQALSPLAPLADRGVPSIERLAASFEAVKPRVVAAIEPPQTAPAAEAPLSDRVWFALGNVVSVSKVGDPEPGDKTAPVKAVSDALARGDLEGALRDFAAIPEPGRAAAADWLAEAKAAHDGRAAVRTETATALQKLSRK